MRPFPPEILIHILENLPLYEVYDMSQINAYWYHIAHCTSIWQKGILVLGAFKKDLVWLPNSHPSKLRPLRILDRSFIHQWHSQLNNVRHVVTTWSNFQDFHLETMTRLFPKLISLDLSKNSDLSAEGLMLLTRFHHLKDLSISHLSQLTDGVLHALSLCPIISLNISKCTQLSAFAIEGFIDSRRDTLESLNLNGLYQLDDSDFESIAKRLTHVPHLKTLNLSHNPTAITLDVLEFFSQWNGEEILEIDVHGCERLTGREIKRLMDANSKLKIVHDIQLFDYSLESIKNYLDMIADPLL
jgi:hypothetical protein